MGVGMEETGAAGTGVGCRDVGRVVSGLGGVRIWGSEAGQDMGCQAPPFSSDVRAVASQASNPAPPPPAGGAGARGLFSLHPCPPTGFPPFCSGLAPSPAAITALRRGAQRIHMGAFRDQISQEAARKWAVSASTAGLTSIRLSTGTQRL